MTDATDLFEAVKLAYDNDGLITLTNIRDRTADSIDETYGDATAQSVIDLWPAWAQNDYDASNALHVEVAMEGWIALAWRRGGTSSAIAEVNWDSVFGPAGMISNVKKTGPRGRSGPKSNSNVTQPTGLTSTGRRKVPWSHPDSFPVNFAPNDVIARG